MKSKNRMNITVTGLGRGLLVSSLILGTVGLAACTDESHAEDAAEDVDDAMEDVSDTFEDGVDKTEDLVEEGAEEIEKAVDDVDGAGS